MKMKMKALTGAVLATIGFGGLNSVYADNILVIQGEGEHEQVYSAIDSFKTGLVNGGNSVTIADSVIANDLANYGQVWTIRPQNILSSEDASAFSSYLHNGGQLVLSGEHGGYSAAGNSALIEFIESQGGGILSLIDHSNNDTQTLKDGGNITYGDAGGLTNAGTGEYLSQNNEGDGSAVAWNWEDLGISESDATLALILDINYHEMDFAGAQELLKQLGIEFGSIDVIDDDHNQEVIIASQETAQEETSRTTLRSQVTTVTNVVASHFKQLKRSSSGQFNIKNASAYSPSEGLNAGDSVSGMAIWFTPTYSRSNNTRSISNDGDYDEKNTSYLAGVDYVVNTNIVIGALAGYEKSKADFNNGGDKESSGLMGAIYGAYTLTPQSTVYAQAGFGRPENDLDDMSSGTLITGDYDSKKMFFGLGAIYNTQYNNYNITLDGGYNWAKDDPDSYTDSKGNSVSADATTVQLVSANAEVAKPFNWGEVYVTGGIQIDLSSPDDDASQKSYDSFGGVVGAGARFNASENLFGEVYINSTVMRKYEHGGHTVGANLRYTF